MNKRKPQKCVEVCMCLLLWKPAWLGFSSYQGREFGHWEEHINCVRLWTGGWAGVPASLGCFVVILLSESGTLFSLYPLALLPGGEFLLLPALVAANSSPDFRWWNIKVAIEVSGTFWVCAVLLYRGKGCSTLRSTRKQQQHSLDNLLGRTWNAILSGKEQSEARLKQD